MLPGRHLAHHALHAPLNLSRLSLLLPHSSLLTFALSHHLQEHNWLFCLSVQFVAHDQLRAPLGRCSTFDQITSTLHVMLLLQCNASSKLGEI